MSHVPDYPPVSVGGITELRIHGVSGTPVESMLMDPHPVQVTGDPTAGCYRRPDDLAATPQPQERHLDAYSWGGLTAGRSTRAAWLLLLPFMLLNVASWAHPVRAGKRSGPVGTMSGAIRALGLSLTLVLVLATAVLGMDVVTWQCGNDTGCRTAHWYTRWLRHVGNPSARVALGALLPVVLILLIRWLSHSTTAAYEDYGHSEDDKDPDLPYGAKDLAKPKFWNGGGPVKRQRQLHVTASFALLAGYLAYAAHHLDTKDHGTAAYVLVAVATAVVVLIAALLASPITGRRRELLEGTTPHPVYCRAVAIGPYAAFALLVAALAYAMWVVDARVTPPATPPAGSLPGTLGISDLLVAAQALLLAGLLAATLWAKATAPKPPPGSRKQMFGGFAEPFLALLGTCLAGAYAAGLSFRLADMVGDTIPGDCAKNCTKSKHAILLPRSYAWSARGFTAAAVVAVFVGIAAWVMLRMAAGAALPLVAAEYPGDVDAARRKEIAKAHATATMTDLGAALVAWVVLGGVAGAVILTVWLPSLRNPATTAGTWLSGAFAFGLVAVGRSAYRNVKLRRTVGIAWDLGAFWPRAAHPFAPPCYAERAVPEFARRIRQIREGGGAVVVSAHSQGAVIAAATVLQEYEDPGGLALVTYGAPLQRLYGRLFPHFFGREVLTGVDTLLGGRWVNLYRRSDPIGGPVLVGDADVPLDDATTPPLRPDRRLHDPTFGRDPYAFRYPKAYGHSNYFHDPAFAQTVDALAGEVG